MLAVFSFHNILTFLVTIFTYGHGSRFMAHPEQFWSALFIVYFLAVLKKSGYNQYDAAV